MSDERDKYIGKKVKVIGNSRIETEARHYDQIVGCIGVAMSKCAYSNLLGVKISDTPNYHTHSGRWFVDIKDLQLINEENLVGKRVRITAPQFGTYVTGTIKHVIDDTAHPYRIQVDGVKSPVSLDGCFVFRRDEFEIIDEEPQEKEQKEMSYKNIVENTFKEAEELIKKKYEAARQMLCEQDIIYKEAIQLRDKLHELNARVVLENDLDSKSEIHISPENYTSKETYKKVEVIYKSLKDYLETLRHKKVLINEQLDAYSSHPREQERILIAYTILGNTGTVQPVNEVLAKKLLDLEGNAKLF